MLRGLIVSAFFLVTAIAAGGKDEVDLPPAPRPVARTQPLSVESDTTLPERALKEVDIPEGLPINLKESIKNTFSADAVERGNAAKALGELHAIAAPAIPFLIRVLGDNAVISTSEYSVEGMTYQANVTVGANARHAIVEIGTPAVGPCIEAMKRSAGTKCGNELIHILGTIKDPRAIEPLSSLLSHPHPLVRDAAVDALKSWRDSRVVPSLIIALKDDDAGVRRSSVLAFQGLQDARAVYPLIGALEDKDVSVRDEAVKALAEQKDSRVVPALMGVLENAAQKEWVRSQAARALGTIGDPKGIEAVMAAVKDRGGPHEVREGAIWGLADSTDRRYTGILIPIAKDVRDTPNVRGAAVGAIAKLEGRAGVRCLTEIALTESGDAYVRWVAAMSVVRLTSGAVDDVGIVNGLRAHYTPGRSISAVVRATEATKKAVREVAKQGKTEAVRTAAIALLREHNWELEDKTKTPSASNTTP